MKAAPIKRLWRWAFRSLRDLGLNLAGFLLVFGTVGALGAGIRTGMDKLLAWGQPWPALVFALLAAGVWAMLFGLVRRKDLRNPEGKVLPLSAAGFLLGGAAVWVYIFAGLSYVLMRLGAVQYAAPQRWEEAAVLPDGRVRVALLRSPAGLEHHGRTRVEVPGRPSGRCPGGSSSCCSARW